MAYTEEELQDIVEYLEKKVDRYEEILDSMLSILSEEESFSQDTRNLFWQLYHDFNKD